MATGNTTLGRKIAVIGHSFVKYLPDPPSNVTLLAKPGATVYSLKESSAWGELINLKPHVTFLVIGGK